jgi:hypothetical protein
VTEFFTRMAELTGRQIWLRHAADTAHAMLELFGGDGNLLYTTGSDAEPLIVRPMEVLDGAVPAANSVAATALLRLGSLRGDAELAAQGESLVGALATVASEHPLAAANTVAAYGLARGGTTEIVVTGVRPDLLETVRARFEPTSVVAWGEPDDSPVWAGRDEGRAYVCRNFTCRAPAASAADLEAGLDDELDVDRAAATVPIGQAGPHR